MLMPSSFKDMLHYVTYVAQHDNQERHHGESREAPEKIHEGLQVNGNMLLAVQLGIIVECARAVLLLPANPDRRGVIGMAVSAFLEAIPAGLPGAVHPAITPHHGLFSGKFNWNMKKLGDCRRGGGEVQKTCCVRRWV
jgi:hypothetical protein